jgi:hypothetical protein
MAEYEFVGYSFAEDIPGVLLNDIFEYEKEQIGQNCQKFEIPTQ